MQFLLLNTTISINKQNGYQIYFEWAYNIIENYYIKQTRLLMKGNRKIPAKKNLFQSDEQQKGQQVKNQFERIQQSPKKQTGIARANQIYDAAKIQQNKMYIRKKQEQTELTNQKKKQLQQAKKKKKKQAKNNKKNLFESDSDKPKSSEQQQQKQEQIIQQNKQEPMEPVVQKQAPMNVKSQNKIQQKPISKKIQQPKSDEQQQSNNESQDQQQKQRAEKIKVMLQSQSKISQTNKLKQISFSRLIQKAGVNKQQLKILVYQPIPIGYRAICIFKRIQNGFTQTYQLSLQDDQRALFYCQNQRGSIGANYYISLNKQMDKKSPSYLGKLRGNSTGSVYQLYDYGKQPQNNINRRQWRCSMGRIQYETNFMGMNGPRKLKVVLPNAKTLEQYDSFKLAQDEDLSTFKPPLVVKYKNKQPRWNQRLKSYALNFGGRVKQASIKNFILVQDLGNTQQQFTATNNLVFGKIDEHNFSLEAVYPLSLYQAFGIVMSQFDFKLNCQ